MKVTPKSDSELQEMNCFPEGVYDFEVVDASERISKAGNEMIEVQLRVFNGEHKILLRDWLLDKMPHKVKRFAETTGQIDAYNAGVLDADAFIGRGGRVRVVIEDDANYGKQNRVKDYGEKKGKTTNANAIGSSVGRKAIQEDSADGDCPF